MKNITHKNYNVYSGFYQLRLNFDVETLFPADDKVQLVSEIVDRLDLEPILRLFSPYGRKPVVDPVSMLKILLYCYSEGIYSSRKIEDRCRYDVRLHYLLNGQKAPSFSSISRFRKHLEESTSDLLTQMVLILRDDGEVNLENIYIDGTKIEADANRYAFVWRKSVEKYREKLRLNMAKELFLPEDTPLEEVVERVKYLFQKSITECHFHQIEFVHGIGKRKTPQQRNFEHLKEVLDRFEKYKTHLEIMGERNSYSKTDHDATFMRMKEDHMMNGQLKPGYNIQFASSGGFVIGTMATWHPNDMYTLKPFLGGLLPSFGSWIRNIVADSGYESLENYLFLDEHNLGIYIKPSNYEIQKKKSYNTGIGKRQNMNYNSEKDCYICKAGNELHRRKDRKNKTKSGFESTSWVYQCEDCIGCPHRKDCISKKSEATQSKKSLIFSPEFEKYRKISQENITTPYGIDLRLNRSIQAEGGFSKLKDGLAYDRFRHTGIRSIASEMNLMAMAININKLHSKRMSDQKGVIEYKKAA